MMVIKQSKESEEAVIPSMHLCGRVGHNTAATQEQDHQLILCPISVHQHMAHECCNCRRKIIWISKILQVMR